MCDRRSAGHGRAHESGDGRGTRHAHPFARRQGREPASIAADATYGNGKFLQWLLDRGITPYMRTRDSALQQRTTLATGPERFTYLPESNSYRCPAGERLNYVGLNVRNRAHAYIGSAKRCGACSQKARCTSGRYKYLAIHIHESARQRARELVNTREFSKAQRQSKKVEALFAELKNQIGLRRLRLRRMKFVREQFFLAAAAQNIKRLVRFLGQPTIPAPAVSCLDEKRKRVRGDYPTTQMVLGIIEFFQQPRLIAEVTRQGSANGKRLGQLGKVLESSCSAEVAEHDHIGIELNSTGDGDFLAVLGPVESRN